MKILYGVCGEGFGHSSRALVIGEYLKKKGHKLKILTYGQADFSCCLVFYSFIENIFCRTDLFLNCDLFEKL